MKKKEKHLKDPYLADRLILLIVRVVAGEQETTVSTTSFTRTVESTDYNQVQRVANAFEVVLLELKKI